MKFTRKLLRRICTDYGVPIPEIQRGTPSQFSDVERGSDGCCVYDWYGNGCLIIAKCTTDMDVMMHELAHVIVGRGHNHDEV